MCCAPRLSILSRIAVPPGKVEVHLGTVVDDVFGTTEGDIPDGGSPLTGVLVRDDVGEKEVPLRGLFYAIGHRPNTGLFGVSLKGGGGGDDKRGETFLFRQNSRQKNGPPALPSFPYSKIKAKPHSASNKVRVLSSLICTERAMFLVVFFIRPGFLLLCHPATAGAPDSL